MPPAFDQDSVRWEMIGPVFENHFGEIFSFPVNLIADLNMILRNGCEGFINDMLGSMK